MYRNVVSYTRSGVQYVWESTWDTDGNRIEIETPIEPYLYYEDTNIKPEDVKYKSMFNKPLRKMTFKTNYERNEWIKTSKNIPLFEKLTPTKQYLLNKYFGLEQDEHFSQYPFRIFNIDIEVEIEGKFPDPLYADYPINVISLYDTLTSNVLVWIYNKDVNSKFTKEHEKEITKELKEKYDVNINQIIYCCFEKEHLLLENFLNYWEHNYPDVLTGWNCVDINSPIWLSDRISLLKDINNSTILYNNNIINNIFPITNKQKYIVHLINGYEINSSKDHKFEVFTLPKGKYTNFCAKTDKFEFKTIENIYDNMKDNNFYVKIPKHINFNNDLTYREFFKSNQIILNEKTILTEDILNIEQKNNIILKSKSKNNIILDEKIDIDMCYTLGLLYTDGTRDFKSNVVTVYNKNYQVLKRVSNVFDRYKYNNGKQKQNNINETILFRNNKILKYNWVKTGSNNIIGLLADNFIYQGKNKKLNVELLSRFSEKQFFAFLSGLIDGDGHVSKRGDITWCNYINDCNSLHQLLLWNGIYNSFNKNLVYIPRTKFNMEKITSNLSLCIDYKRQRLNNCCTYKNKPNRSNNIKFLDCGDFYSIKIFDIIKTEQYIPMRDIETNNHTFNINGVSVHNCNVFDLTYIVNRIIKVLGEGNQYRLSPIQNTKKPVYSIYDEEKLTVIYKIQGISICDYLDLYKKFAGRSKQSFKLDYIANIELGFGKLDYYDMGFETIYDFMNNDFSTFIKYNIIDTVLVKLLNDKLKFIELMRKICNISLIEYESIFKAIPAILGALTIQAKYNNVCFLTDANKSDDNKNQNDGYEGAFVFPTKPGYYKNGIVSFDFNSLYPNVMMTINISPETKVGKVVSNEQDPDITIRKVNGKLITISKEQFQKILDEKCTLSANKVLYIKPNIKQGIIPQFLDKTYKMRKETKNKMKINKKKVKELDEQIKQLEEQLKNL